MTALATERAGKYRTLKYDLRPIATNVKCWKGGAAMVITSSTSAGYVTPASSSLVGVVVGVFTETVDNTGGADGAALVNVEYPHERSVRLFANDTGTPIVVANRESQCYMLDDQTVTGAVETVAAGVVYDLVGTTGVWVEVGVEGSVAELAPGISAVAPVDPSSSAASAGAATLAAAQDHKHHIADATPAAEGLMSSAYASAISPVTATITSLKGIGASARADGMIVQVQTGTGGSSELWTFSAASTASDTSQNLVATPTAGSGRWLRLPGLVNLSLAIDKTMADNATIFTVPVGARLHVLDAWFDVLVSWSGGSSSAIGVHSSVSGWSTKGDILGGTTGDVAATLVSTNTRMTGTIGTQMDTRTHGRLITLAADTLNYDKITSTFTAGSANVRVLCDLITNPGA